MTEIWGCFLNALVCNLNVSSSAAEKSLQCDIKPPQPSQSRATPDPDSQPLKPINREDLPRSVSYDLYINILFVPLCTPENEASAPEQLIWVSPLARAEVFTPG